MFYTYHIALQITIEIAMEKSEGKCWSQVVNEGDGKARNTIGRQVEKVIGDVQTGRPLVASGSMFFCFYFNLLRIQGDGHEGRHFVARRSNFFRFFILVFFKSGRRLG